jgi:hypothetical protein
LQRIALKSGAPQQDRTLTFFLVSLAVEFPRIQVSGNSPSCIKREYLESMATLRASGYSPSQVLNSYELGRSVLWLLGLATACSADRILMHLSA